MEITGQVLQTCETALAFSAHVVATLNRLGIDAGDIHIQDSFDVLVARYENLQQTCDKVSRRLMGQPLVNTETLCRELDALCEREDEFRINLINAKLRCERILERASILRSELLIIEKHARAVSSTDERASSASDQPRSADAGASAESGRD